MSVDHSWQTDRGHGVKVKAYQMCISKDAQEDISIVREELLEDHQARMITNMNKPKHPKPVILDVNPMRLLQNADVFEKLFDDHLQKGS